MDKKISITQVVKNSYGEFTATVVVSEEWEPDRHYHAATNKDGEGLWLNGKQVAGTCQFKTRSPGGFRSALRRWFAD